MAIIEARNLVKRFGAVAAADDLSVAIGADSVVGLIGANGAGKTTFINMITGYLKPDTGSILFEAIRSFATEYSPNTWQMVLGVAMLAVIMFLPSGLWSLFQRRGVRG